MLMADTMAVFFVVLGLTLALVSLSLLARGLWPDAVRITTDRIERGLVVPFLVGIPIAFIPLLAAVVLAKLGGPAGVVVGAVVLSATVFHGFIGVAGLATCVGQRLASASDVSRPWRATLRGSVVLVLSGLLPVVGWFVLLPIAFITGSGAATIALVRKALGSRFHSVPDSPELVFGTPSPGSTRQ